MGFLNAQFMREYTECRIRVVWPLIAGWNTCKRDFNGSALIRDSDLEAIRTSKVLSNDTKDW